MVRKCQTSMLYGQMCQCPEVLCTLQDSATVAGMVNRDQTRAANRPTAAETALLVAAANDRLWRFYHPGADADAVISGVGGGGRDADPKVLASAAEKGWLEPPAGPGGDGVGSWRITETGRDVLERWRR